MQKPHFVLLFAIAFAVALHANAEVIPSLHAEPPIAISHAGQPPDEVIKFWTSENMTKAWEVPYDLPSYPIDSPLDPLADLSGYTLAPAPYADHELSRITGILFFRRVYESGDELRHCSASVITSRSQSLILTAAHCIHDASDGYWYDMLMFVPAYREREDHSKEIPLGKWPIYRAYIPYDGAGGEGNEGDDIAVASVYPDSPPIGPAIKLEQRVGSGLQPKLNTPDDTFSLLKVIGYPASHAIGDPPYSLGEQRECDTHTQPNAFNKTIVLLNCAPRPGNSGGPLIDISLPRRPQVVGVFAKTTPSTGQPRLLFETFLPMYRQADSEALP